MLKVLNPTAGPARGKSGIAPRPARPGRQDLSVSSGTGARTATASCWEAVDLLKQRYRVRDVLFREKPFLGNIAPEPILAELAAKSSTW